MVTKTPGAVSPSTRPSIEMRVPEPVLAIAAAALPRRTVASVATMTRVFDVAMVSPSLSMPLQFVVPLATVGSGAHCACADEPMPIATMLVPSASDHRRNRTER